MAGNYDVGIAIKAFDDFSPTFKKLEKSFSEIERGLERTTSKIGKFGAKMKSLSKSLAIRVTAPILAGGAYIFKQVNDFDELHKRLLLTTGSATTANQALEGIRKTFKETEVPLDQLGKTTMALLGFGYSVEKANQQTKMFAEIAEGTSAGFEAVSNTIIRAEMRAKKNKGGFIDPMSAQRLLRTIPALSVEIRKMGEQAGISGENAYKAFVRGKVGVSLLDEALMRVSKNKATDTMEESLTKVHHIFQLFAEDIGESISGTTDAKAAVDSFRATLSKAEDTFRDFVGHHATLVKYVAIFLAIAAVMAPILYIGGLLLGVFAAIFSPIGLIVVGIAAIGFGIYKAYKQLKPFRDFCNAIWEIIKKIAEFWYKIIGSKVVKAAGWVYHKMFTETPAGKESPKTSITPMGAKGIAQTHNVNATSTVNLNINYPKGIVGKVSSSDASTKVSSLNRGAYMAPSR
jgi:phage-related minor tail protein